MEVNTKNSLEGTVEDGLHRQTPLEPVSTFYNVYRVKRLHLVVHTPLVSVSLLCTPSKKIPSYGLNYDPK